MKRSLRSVVLLLVVGLPSLVTAELEYEEKERATHVVSGTVEKVFSRSSGDYIEHVALVRIETKHRGEFPQHQQHIYVYSFDLKPGVTLSEPGPSGHKSPPAEGANVKVWAIYRTGEMYGLYPDWFEIIPKKEKDPKE